MSSVLVLDKSWSPVEYTTVFDSIVKLYKDKVRALDHNYQLHTLESWVESWKDAEDVSKQVLLHSANFSIVVPEVIVLRGYTCTKFRKRAKLNRRNVFLRDNNTCQYCGRQGKTKNFNIDHVLPQAQGGKSVWKNLVLSCISCNQEKGNRTPAQAGMHLSRKPFEPKWFELHDKADPARLETWSELLGQMYWNVGLED